MKNTRPLRILAFAITITVLLSCNDKNEKTPTNTVTTDTIAQKKVKPEPRKAPVINITDTLSVKRIVLCMKDSAATTDRIGMKLGLIYGVKLINTIKKNKLKVTGAPIAWYKSQKAPFFFEAGMPVDKKPAKLPAGMMIKEIGTDSVVVAHFYGPYELTVQAYEALGDWMKSHKKQMKGMPYEIYVDDPMDKDGKLKDPYKVQTDIVFTWK